MGWKAEARRTLVGPKSYLETLPDPNSGERTYWIRPRKWSIEAADKIRAKEHELKKSLGKEGLALITRRQDVMQKITEAKDRGESITDADIMHMLSPEELEALVTGTAPQDQAELVKLQIFHGVYDHNLDDENGEVIKITEDDVGDFLEFPDVATEIVGIVRGWNRPLADGRSATSETSPSGASTDSDSSQTDPTSQTEQTPTDSSKSGGPG